MTKNSNYISDEKRFIEPKYTPLEYFLITTSYPKGKEEHELIKFAKDRFEVEKSVVKKTLSVLIGHDGYINEDMRYLKELNHFNLKPFVSISKSGSDLVSSNEYVCSDKGEKLYRQVFTNIVNYNVAYYPYNIVDFAGDEDIQVDLTIYFFKSKTGKRATLLDQKVDPDNWIREVVPVTVELNPETHRDRVYRNYQRDVSQGLKVCFGTFNYKDMECIVDIMTEHHIDKEAYNLIFMSSEDMDDGLFKQNGIKRNKSQ